MSGSRWKAVFAIGVAVCLCLQAGIAFAQDGGVDVEELLLEQTAPAGPGSLIDNLAPDAAARRSVLQKDYGIAATAAYTVYAQTANVAGRDVVAGDLGLAARWTFLNRGRSDAGSLVAYFENRHNFGGSNGFEFANEVGAGWFPHPIPNEGHSRLRQLYIKQNFVDDQLVTGVGKFSLRGLVNRSAFLGDRRRDFTGFPTTLDPSFSPPVDAFGAVLRVQPADRPISIMAGVFDADPDLDRFDLDIEGPFSIAELQISDRPYRRDVDLRQPDLVIRLTGYHRPETSTSKEAAGGTATVDWRLWDAENPADPGEVGLGLRYGFETQEAGAFGHLASLGLVVRAPFDRSRDALGAAATLAVTLDGEAQWSSETFYRLNLFDGFELSAGLQIVVDPVFSDESLSAIPGIRTLLQF